MAKLDGSWGHAVSSLLADAVQGRGAALRVRGEAVGTRTGAVSARGEAIYGGGVRCGSGSRRQADRLCPARNPQLTPPGCRLELLAWGRAGTRQRPGSVGAGFGGGPR
jgi:hypothetical protein